MEKHAELFELIAKLVANELRFTVIHNPNEKKFLIVSATQCDKIKHKFPEFNIYLSGNDKMVEKVFYY